MSGRNRLFLQKNAAKCAVFLQNRKGKWEEGQIEGAKMKERPIIFSGPMVRAILDGRKTQTRRVIRNPERLDGLMNAGEAAEWCPYGQPGDLLWVRETWAQIWECDPPDPSELPEALDSMPWHLEYKADSGAKYPGEWPDDMGDDPNCAKWQSSLFMPKWAARLWLRITNVRVERLCDITEENILAEGVALQPWAADNCQDWARTAGFAQLWDSINSKRGYSWESNPWVWVIDFQKVKRGEDSLPS